MTLPPVPLAPPSAHVASAEYAEQLEPSCCTQVTEAQGCTIRKSRAENAKTQGMIAGG